MDPDKFDDLIGPLQRHNQLQQATKAAKQLEEIARNLSKAKSEEDLLPQCPFCGGRIPVGFAKCKNCASDLIWFHKFPGKPGEEIELQRSVLLMEQKAARIRQSAANQKMAAQQSDDKASDAGVKFVLAILAIVIIIFIGVLLWVNLFGSIEI